MNKKWSVKLSEEDQEKLKNIVRKGKSSARVIRKAQTLLLSAEGKQTREIAALLKCVESTIYSTKRKYCQEGLEAALNEKPRSGRPQKLVGKAKAHLIALACSEPPEGRACWTMQLLAEHCISLELVEFISDDTVGRVLKKTKSSRGK